MLVLALTACAKHRTSEPASTDSSPVADSGPAVDPADPAKKAPGPVDQSVSTFPHTPTRASEPAASADDDSDPAGPHAQEPPPTHRVAPPDAPLPPPDCGGALAPGETRVEIPDVIGRAAIGADGALYLPRRSADGELMLSVLDACGEVTWERVVSDVLPDRPVLARLPNDNEVVLDALRDPRRSRTFHRFDRQGELLSGLTEEVLAQYPEWLTGGEGRQIARAWAEDTGAFIIDLSEADPRGGAPVDARFYEEECAGFGERLLCYEAAFDLNTLEALWTRAPAELLDGTTRHVNAPASDGERLYAIVYGVSNYRLVAKHGETGERLWSHELGPSPSGQYGLVTGGPVIGPDGTLYVYIAYSKRPVIAELAGDIVGEIEPPEHHGFLIAYDRDGVERWRLSAPSGRASEFWEHGSHVLGRDGLLYLAVASGVYAVDSQTGEVRFRREDLSVGAPRIALSPNGDLLVQLTGDRLALLATGSSGTAGSPWPAPYGDRRNLNWR